MAAGKPFRITKQIPDGEHIKPRPANLCHGCYQPIPKTQGNYCSGRCLEAHTRLRGAA